MTATDDVDALLALDPDCVSYNPIWFDVDEVCRLDMATLLDTRSRRLERIGRDERALQPVEA